MKTPNCNFEWQGNEAPSPRWDSRAPLRLGPEIVLVDQPMEGLAIDAGGLGRGRDIAVVSREQIPEIRNLQDLEPLLFGRLEREVGARRWAQEGKITGRRRRSRRTRLRHVIGQFPHRDHLSVSECAGPLHHVLELAHVSRPGIAL